MAVQVAKQTTLETVGDETTVTFYGTKIAVYSPAVGNPTKVLLNARAANGRLFHTQATKARMNQFGFGADSANMTHVFGYKGQWYVLWNGCAYPYSDGMTLETDRVYDENGDAVVAVDARQINPMFRHFCLPQELAAAPVEAEPAQPQVVAPPKKKPRAKPRKKEVTEGLPIEAAVVNEPKVAMSDADVASFLDALEG